MANITNSLWYEDECFPIRDNAFLHFLKNSENSNYVNFLENNIVNESLKVAVCIKININHNYEVF